MAHPSTGRPSRLRGRPVPPQAVMAPDMLMGASSHTAGKLLLLLASFFLYTCILRSCFSAVKTSFRYVTFGYLP